MPANENDHLSHPLKKPKKQPLPSGLVAGCSGMYPPVN